MLKMQPMRWWRQCCSHAELRASSDVEAPRHFALLMECSSIQIPPFSLLLEASPINREAAGDHCSYQRRQLQAF